MDSTKTLPTVPECVEFHRLVNVGRAAGGLDPLDTLDFDGAVPCNPTACLSATNLFIPCGFSGVADEFGVDRETDVLPVHERVAEALGAKRYDGRNWTVPAAIMAVTDPFDGQLPSLRARLVEAGVVAP